MIAEKEILLKVKIKEDEMKSIFEVADLLEKIEEEIFEDYETKVKTLTFVEEPTDHVLSTNSKLEIDNFVAMHSDFREFFGLY